MLQNQWSFDTAHYKPISQADVTYWVHMLNKVLKVGIEFEFNLPEAKGVCDGSNTSCPCKVLLAPQKENKPACWKQCCNQADCSYVKEHKKCIGENCSEFTPFCYICNLYAKDCNKCSLRIDQHSSPKHIRQRVRDALAPTQSYGRYGKSGCHKVIQDGSLRGDKGMEVVTIGRRVDFWEFYNMTKQIIDLALENKGYVDELCSIHMHMLTSYYGKVSENEENDPSIPNDINELEHSMPGVIAANFHQLCRRYQNSITWMAMGLDNPKHLTRWEKYRMSILGISPAAYSFGETLQKIAALGAKHKYAWANYMFTKIDRRGDIDKFHVEMRVLDCIMSPSIVSAFACLFQAMLIRAVELSRYGLLQAGDAKWSCRAEKIKDVLMNKTEGWPDKNDPVGRKSNNEGLATYTEELVGESLDLIQQLKHLFTHAEPAYEVLEKLAKTPVAFMRCEGATWEQIEKHFFPVRKTVVDPEIEEAVDRFVCLRLLSNCPSMAHWVNELSNTITPDLKDKSNVKEKVEMYIESQQLNGQLVWSSALGTAMKIQQ